MLEGTPCQAYGTADTALETHWRWPQTGKPAHFDQAVFDHPAIQRRHDHIRSLEHGLHGHLMAVVLFVVIFVSLNQIEPAAKDGIQGLSGRRASSGKQEPMAPSHFFP